MSRSVFIIGMGFVGNALYSSFDKKKLDVGVYDKYKNQGELIDCLAYKCVFLCLPTVYLETEKKYDLQPIHETCKWLEKMEYTGLVVIKSTVTPTTTSQLYEHYPTLCLVHNPEFLSAATADEDFHNQSHIVIGYPTYPEPNSSIDWLRGFYTDNYPDATISMCTSTESESVKLGCNTFYSVKIQYFNELYAMCKKVGCNYDTVKTLMIKNDWINPMHTDVPGSDGKLSYGGYCFPKDTNALMQFMHENNTPHQVLSACIQERNSMRVDQTNIEKQTMHNAEYET